MKSIKLSNLILAGSLILLCLILGRLILDWQIYRSLQAELRQGDYLIATVVQGKFEDLVPSQNDLLRVIDECVEVFQAEEVAIRSYQLEGTHEDESLAGLNYALIRFKLLGSWMGIEKGVAGIEGLTKQGIQVKEALLSLGSGEILLKIYFLQPGFL